MNHLAKIGLIVTTLGIMILVFSFSAQAQMPFKKPNKINKQIAKPSTAAPSAAPTAIPPAENLKLIEFTTSARQIRAGDSMTVSAMVKNMGTMRSGPFSVKFYIAKNRAGGNSKRLLKTMPGFRLARNSSKDFNSPVTIPDNLRTSRYWLIVKITKSNPRSVKDVKAKQLRVQSASAPNAAPTIVHNRSNSDSSQIRPEIRSISPAQVTTGQSLTISGDRFGPPQGTVELGFSEPAVLAPLTVISWNNRRIVAQVPDDIDTLVPPGNSAVALWVKPRGFEEHGIKTSKITRLVSGLVPRIQSLSSQTVRPGQEIWVKGHNFLAEQPGEIKFFFHDRQFTGIVMSGNWRDQQVKVVLPDSVSGITSTNGYIEVKNFRGRKSRHEITFIPKLESRHLYESADHYYKTDAILGQSRAIKVFIFTNLTGHHVKPFINNWVIKTVDVKKILGKGSCSIIPEVTTGSTHLPVQMKIKVTGNYESVACSCQIEIEGPAGTNPY